MLNRIFLGIAIAAGIFVGAWGMFKVKPQIETIMEQRAQEKSDKVKAQTDLAKTKSTLKQTQDKLTQTENNLKTATDEKNRAVSQLQDQVKKYDELTAREKAVREQRDKAQGDLVAWESLGIKVNEIKGMIQQLKDVIAERDAITEEKKILMRSVAKLQNKINELIGTNTWVELPAGLRGKVLQVDPKWDFCVLDFGEKQNALERGELLVSRNGQLIARLRIQSVQPDRCIANIIPGWRLQDVVEGDTVFPAHNN